MLNCQNQIEKVEKFKYIKSYVKNLSLWYPTRSNCTKQEVGSRITCKIGKTHQ